MCSCVCVSGVDVCARVWVPLEVRGVGSLLSWATGSCELSDVVRSSSRAVLSLNQSHLSSPTSSSSFFFNVYKTKFNENWSVGIYNPWC